MFRMWGKLWKDNHLLRDTVAANGDYSMSRTAMVFQALDEICREFDLDYRAAFHGCSGDTEPSLATLKYLIDKVNDEHIPVVYTIDLSSQKVAEAVSECTGARIERLWSMQTVSRADFDAGETYLTLMQRNYEALKGGLL